MKLALSGWWPTQSVGVEISQNVSMHMRSGSACRPTNWKRSWQRGPRSKPKAKAERCILSVWLQMLQPAAMLTLLQEHGRSSLWAERPLKKMHAEKTRPPPVEPRPDIINQSWDSLSFTQWLHALAFVLRIIYLPKSVMLQTHKTTPALLTNSSREFYSLCVIVLSNKAHETSAY